MEYEFVEDVQPAGEVPVAPDFWRAEPKHINELWLETPAFICHGSVIEDPHDGKIGIDTIDCLPNVTIEGPDNPLVGAMRIYRKFGETILDGYLADVRYARQLIRRELDFTRTVYKDEDLQDKYKTLPALGVIFSDREKNLYFQCRYKEELRLDAIALMTFVDEGRRQLGKQVLGPKEETADTSEQASEYTL